MGLSPLISQFCQIRFDQRLVIGRRGPVLLSFNILQSCQAQIKHRLLVQAAIYFQIQYS